MRAAALQNANAELQRQNELLQQEVRAVQARAQREREISEVHHRDVIDELNARLTAAEPQVPTAMPDQNLDDLIAHQGAEVRRQRRQARTQQAEPSVGLAQSAMRPTPFAPHATPAVRPVLPPVQAQRPVQHAMQPGQMAGHPGMPAGRTQHPPLVSTPPKSIRMPQPPDFDGKVGEVAEDWINTVQRYWKFSLSEHAGAEVTFTLAKLKGAANNWY